MTWLDLAVATITAAAVVFLPGLVVGLALGLRGLRLWGLAAPAGVSVVCIAALGAPVVGLSWSPLPVLIVVVAVAAVGLVIRWVYQRAASRTFASRAESGGSRGGSVFALLLAGFLIAGQVVAMMGDPANISQTFDNIFHLNAIRFAADEGNASPLFLATMTSGDQPPPFYPSGWHAVGSLVVLITSAAVPVASNGVMLVFAALVWPASIVLLVRELDVVGRFGLIAAGAAAAAFPAFPMLMLEYGVLYPFMMGVSIVPAALAVVLRICRPDRAGGRLPWMLILLGIVPGIAISHPGAFVGMLALATAAVAVTAVTAIPEILRPGLRLRRISALAAALAYIGILAAVWYVLRPEDMARTWEPQETVGQAIGEVVAIAPWNSPVNLVMTVLVAVAVIAAVRRHRIGDVTMLGIFAIAAALYIVVSGVPYWEFRDAIVGPWYNNAPRLAALLPIAWVPLAAVGAESIWRAARSWQSSREGLVSSFFAIAAAAALILVAIPQLVTMRQAVASAAPLYRFTEDSPLLSSDELALIRRLPAKVPDDAVLVGSPWTGVALAYALTGRDVLMPHTLTTTTKDADLINDGLRNAVADSAVCRAVDELNAEFVLDFGTNEVHFDEHVYPGIRGMATSSAVELIDSEGAAKLYRVVACDT